MFYLYLPNILMGGFEESIYTWDFSTDCESTRIDFKHPLQSILWLLATNKNEHRIRVKFLLDHNSSTVRKQNMQFNYFSPK